MVAPCQGSSRNASCRRNRAAVSAAVQSRHESDRDAVVEGKSAFAKMGVPGCRAFAGNGAPGIFRRQSPGLYRLVFRGWVLPVILRVATKNS